MEINRNTTLNATFALEGQPSADDKKGPSRKPEALNFERLEALPADKRADAISILKDWLNNSITAWQAPESSPPSSWTPQFSAEQPKPDSSAEISASYGLDFDVTEGSRPTVVVSDFYNGMLLPPIEEPQASDAELFPGQPGFYPRSATDKTYDNQLAAFLSIIGVESDAISNALEQRQLQINDPQYLSELNNSVRENFEPSEFLAEVDPRISAEDLALLEEQAIQVQIEAVKNPTFTPNREQDYGTQLESFLEQIQLNPEEIANALERMGLKNR